MLPLYVNSFFKATLKGKNLLSIESKFFSLRVAPYKKEGKYFHAKVTSLGHGHPHTLNSGLCLLYLRNHHIFILGSTSLCQEIYCRQGFIFPNIADTLNLILHSWLSVDQLLVGLDGNIRLTVCVGIPIG